MNRKRNRYKNKTERTIEQLRKDKGVKEQSSIFLGIQEKNGGKERRTEDGY